MSKHISGTNGNYIYLLYNVMTQKKGKDRESPHLSLSLPLSLSPPLFLLLFSFSFHQTDCFSLSVRAKPVAVNIECGHVVGNP